MVKQGKDSGLPLVRFDQGEPLPPSGSFIVLVDGQRAPLLPLDLPAGLKGQARERVAARQVSDMAGLSQGAAELRPFVLKGSKSQWQRAIVSATEQLEDWRARVAGTGTRCAAILPDYLALPVSERVWTLHQGTAGSEETTLTARLGLEDGFSADPQLALVLLEKAFKAAPPEAILKLGALDDQVEDWLEGLDLPVFSSADALVEKGFAPPRALEHGELSLDLARDPRAAFEALAARLKAWRLPVVLGVLGLAFWSGGMLVQTRELIEAARSVRADTVAEVRRHFVSTGPVLDIRAQVSRVLAAQSSASGQEGEGPEPLDLLKQASAVIVDYPGALTSSSYQPQGGLTVDLLMPDFATLDQLVGALEQAGLAVAITTAGTAEEGGVAAVLELAAKGAAQ